MTVLPLNPGERAARDARQAWGIDSHGPVGDLLDIAEQRADVPVLIEAFNDGAFAGVLLRHGDGASFVAVNADHIAVRQRFTLAHELGHLWMGHEPRIELSNEVFGSAKSLQEVEANYFAAELLMPRAAVTAWLEERALHDATAEPETAARLAFEFGTSFMTAVFRLDRAGVLDGQAKQSVIAALKDNGKAIAEPYASHRLVDKIDALYRAHDYPRAPRETLALAGRAREAGLLDEQEYGAIVAVQPELDMADWMA